HNKLDYLVNYYSENIFRRAGTQNSGPQLPIQRAKLDRFRNVVGHDFLGPDQVGNGARDFQNAVVSASTEVHFGHRHLEQLHRGFVQRAIGLQFFATHARVASDPRFAGEAFLLPLASGDHALTDLLGSFAGALAADLAKFHGGHFHVQIDAVEQWSGNAPKIILDFARRTARFSGHLSIGGRVHRRHQHELRWESHGAGSARNGDPAFFQRLAHRFQNAAFEFRQFVQKQHAVMRQRNFAGRWIDVAAQQTSIAGGVMRRAKWPARYQRLAGSEQPDDAVNLGRLQRFLQRKRRQN